MTWHWQLSGSQQPQVGLACRVCGPTFGYVFVEAGADIVASDSLNLQRALPLQPQTECDIVLIHTGNTSLLVESSNYLTQHWQQEGQWTSPSYYWPTHDNVAWPAAILLLGQLQRQAVDPEATAASAAMEQHHEALSHMFRGWMAGKVSWPVSCCMCN